MPVISSDASNLGADAATRLNLTWTPGLPVLNANNNGTLDFTLGPDMFTYTRENNALVQPFTSDIRLAVTSISDDDGISANDLPRSFAPTGTQIRYGQMQLQNAYGPETLPLTVPVVTEFFDGTGFVRNGLDSCTTYNSLNATLGGYLGNLALNETVITGNGTLISGLGNNLSLSAPGAGNDGSVGVTLNLSQATGANMQWLQPGGINPTARATFGIFRGNDRLIYMRESIW
jgi:MSHA biogenesis protein MshQ